MVDNFRKTVLLECICYNIIYQHSLNEVTVLLEYIDHVLLTSYKCMNITINVFYMFSTHYAEKYAHIIGRSTGMYNYGKSSCG